MKLSCLVVACVVAQAACGRSGYEMSNLRPTLTQTLTPVDVSGRYYTTVPVVRWGGQCDPGSIVRVKSAIETQDIACADGIWEYGTTLTDDGAFGFEIAARNSQWAQTRIDVTWTLDRSPPTVESLTTSDGDTVKRSWVTASVQASDDLSPIVELCFKYNATAAPTSNDACWRSLGTLAPTSALATSVIVSNTRVLIGLSPGLYRANVWARDAAGNISAISGGALGTVGVDRIDVFYAPGKPPALDKVLATAVAQPSSPPTTGDLTIAANADVFVRWTVSDDTPIPADSIALAYSTDDVVWTPIASGLDNGPADQDCRRGLEGTGCYTWRGGAPSSSFFRIKVIVRDSDNLTSIIESQPINTQAFSVVAGDTSSGIGGSGLGVVFANATSLGDQRIGDPGWFAVSSNRDIFVRDRARGILRTDSTTGNVEVFLPLASLPIGDGVPVSEAAVREPVAIAAGFANDIYIFDYDIIRRVDLSTSPPSIATVVGGGTNTAATTQARDLYIEHQRVPWKRTALVPLPDGRLIFRSETADGGAVQRWRLYDPASAAVTSVVMHGTGVGNNPNQDIATCVVESWGVSFDRATPTQFEVIAMVAQQPASVNPSCPSGFTYYTHTALRLNELGESAGLAGSVAGSLVADNLATGTNGEVYRINRPLGTIDRADLGSSSWVRVLGNNTTSLCAEGAAASGCGASPEDLFVDDAGHVYFAELGVIRVVADDGAVYSLAGQSFDAGDGREARSARFGQLTAIDRFTNAGTLTIQALDVQAIRIREFPLDGTITSIAGTGVSARPVLGMPAATQPIDTGTVQNAVPLIVTESDGAVLYRRGLSITELDRSTGTWSTVIGNGATSYRAADGQAGSAIALTASQAAVAPWGFNGTTLLLSPLAYTTDLVSFVDPMIKRYAAGTWAQSALVSYTGAPSAAWCSLGTSLASCATPLPSVPSLQRAAFDATDSAWIVAAGSSTFYRLVPGASLAQAFVLPQRSVAFEYRRNGANIDVWYCTTAGELHAYDVASAADTILDLHTPSLGCSGSSMFYDAALDALFFIVRSTSGLTAIARYQSP